MKIVSKHIFCVALAAMVFVFPCLSASAVNEAEIDRLEQQRSELQLRSDNIDEQLASFEQAMESGLARKSLLDEQSVLLLEEMELLESQIALYDDIIADKREECETAEEIKQEHYELYCARVRDMEEGSAWSYLSYILKADSISSLISRISDISDVMSYDEQLRKEFISSCDNAEAALAEYEAVQSAQIKKQNELECAKAELEEKIEASASILAALEEDIDAYMAYQEDVESELAKVQEEIDRKAEELRKQQEAEKKPAVSVPTGSGYYMWPSATTYITSPFGPRVHPIYGQLKPHTGVDIGAWYGTEIYAAADGVVSMAVVNYGSTGYGTYVAIYHPNGTTTLYGHMSALAVSTGQSVSKGQVIGYVGSTGASNGPHIHFEIRVNGACVDPMQYY